MTRHLHLGFRVALHVLLLTAGVACWSAQVASTGRDATEDERERLRDALQAVADDMPRWAYTERRVVRDEKGRTKSTSVVRVDPSKPYAEQYVPILIDDKPPSSRDIAKYRKKGQQAEKRDERIERGGQDERVSLGELIEPGRARIASEDARAVVYEVPLRADKNRRFPPEKFEVLVHLAQKSWALSRIEVRLREAFRSRLILKVKSGGGTIEFSSPDPAHPPTLTAARGDASASILFVSVGGDFEYERTDLRHVTPYRERFGVKIGTLKAIDF